MSLSSRLGHKLLPHLHDVRLDKALVVLLAQACDAVCAHAAKSHPGRALRQLLFAEAACEFEACRERHTPERVTRPLSSAVLSVNQAALLSAGACTRAPSTRKKPL